MTAGPRASGVGSWPDEPVRGVVRRLRDLLDGQVPYLPELPGRGPGADLVGRTATQLVHLPVDLQPSGWRLTGGGPGRDVARAQAYLREDLDELAEAYDGYTGPLKVAVCGPWTLAASVWLPRGERVADDPGATRDLVQSLAETVGQLLDRIARLVPGGELIVQLDEPSLPAVLAGRLPTVSGFGRLRAVEPGVVEAGLREVLAAAGERASVVHCCAQDVPFALLRRVGGSGLSIDTTLLTPRTWESVAATVEAGTTLWAGVLPTGAAGTHPAAVIDPFLEGWRRVGLPDAALADLVLTPACGLATRSPQQATASQQLAVQSADYLAEQIA